MERDAYARANRPAVHLLPNSLIDEVREASRAHPRDAPSPPLDLRLCLKRASRYTDENDLKEAAIVDLRHRKQMLAHLQYE